MPRSFSAATDRVNFSGAALPTSGALSVVTLVRTGADVTGVVLARGGGNVGWTVGTFGTSDVMRFSKRGVVNVDSTLTLSANTTYALGWTHVANGNIVFYRRALGDNAATTETVSNASSISVPGSSLSAWGNTYNGDSFNSQWGGSITGGAVFNSVLTPARMEMLLSALLYGSLEDVVAQGPVFMMMLRGDATERDLIGTEHSTSISGTAVTDAPGIPRWLRGAADWFGSFTAGGGGNTVTLGLGSWTFTGLSGTYPVHSVITLGLGSWPFTGLAMTFAQHTVYALGLGAWPFAGLSGVYPQHTVFNIGLGSWPFIGLSLTTSSSQTVTLGLGSWPFGGRALTVIGTTVYQLGVGTWNFIGQSLTIAGQASLFRRLTRPLTRLLLRPIIKNESL